MVDTITEEGLDNVVDAVNEALKREGIYLDSDELTIVNDKLEHFLYHDVGVELE